MTNSLLSRSLSALIVITLAWTPGIFADELEDLAKHLEAAAEYEVGSDSEPLQEIEKLVFELPADSKLHSDVEGQLIKALQSAESAELKRFLCTQLAAIGTGACVPELGDLLTDAEVSHMARRALGQLDSQAATIALEEALDHASGKLKAGIINTLADRNARSSFARIAKQVNSADPIVAKAAIRAMGKFGGRGAQQALESVSTDDKALANEVFNSLVSCAEAFVTSGDTSSAQAIYAEMATKRESPHQRMAGLRGLLVHCEGPESLLIEAIKTADTRQDAIALVAEVQRDNHDLTTSLAALVAQIDEPNRPLLIRALGDRGDPAAADAVFSLVSTGEEPVRMAAVDALGSVGGSDCVATLLSIAATDEPIGKVARASLDRLSGDGIDEVLLSILDHDEEAMVLAAMRSLAARRANVALKSFLVMRKDRRQSVHDAAIEGLGSVAALADLPKLLELAANTPDEDDQFDLIASTGRALRRIKDKDEAADAVSASIDEARSATKPVLIPLLSRVGSEPALFKAQGLLRSPNRMVRRAAVKTLAEWPNKDSLDDLTTVLEENRSGEERQVAVEGIIRLVGTADDAPERFVKMIRRTRRVGEQKTLLAALGQSSADSSDALKAAMGYLEDSRLQATAGLATVRIANRVRRKHLKKAREALEKVIASVENEDVVGRAREVLNEVDRYEGHILEWVGIGPFTDKDKPNGADIFRTKFGPEQPDYQPPEDGPQWKKISEGIGSWDIDLEPTFGGLDHVAAYLRTRVWSPTEQKASLEMAADDAIAAWVNQENVWNQWRGGMSPRRLRAKCQLEEGWNDLQVKVVDHQGGWRFAVRIRRPDGKAIEDIKYEAE